MKPYPKELREENREFLDHVWTLPCYVCEAMHLKQKTPTTPAHIRSVGAKGGDTNGNVMRLCVDHHRGQHSTGVKRFIEWAREKGLDPISDAKNIWEEWNG